jgi:TolB-like protein
MATERAFLIPVIIDDSSDADTTVPDRFREVQWTRLAGGVPTKSFVERVSRLLAAGSDTTGAHSPIAVTLGGAPPSSRRPRTVRPKRRYGLVAATVALLVGAAWFFQHRAATPAPTVAYSAEDRRMTFALLPVQAAGADSIDLQIAKATGDGVFRSLDENHEWVQLAPQASVTKALRQSAVPRDLARLLKVHFVFRGDVVRNASGYSITLFVVDGETEHVLGSKNLPVPAGALAPRAEEIDAATGLLVFYGLESEVARARDKPDAALDVRDLTFRAFLDWGHKRMANEGESAYAEAAALLNRALMLAPDDPLALRMTTQINLCDCVEAWSPDIAKQQAIGEMALDRYLSTHPDDPGMLHQKAILYRVRGRYQESLLILNSLLSRDPENSGAMEDKALALLKLGRPNEAAAPATAAYAARDRPDRAALLAAIDYELADYAAAEQLAQKAITEMSKAQLGNSNDGTVDLTLIAAAAHCMTIPPKKPPFRIS